ncbi:MAG: hypothetical protein D8M58_01660 [Calditrichaeota bacterium]|nr:MAG: hypothetical protein DWQ03_05420 [Calditrichota bacterium]MBL1204074.1 hypothetical protein [Calditrichota bacterium]NOG43905.1 hypothetical protein [Calditrichota bacterium]
MATTSKEKLYGSFISSLEISSITFPKMLWDLKNEPEQGKEYTISPGLRIDGPRKEDNSSAIFDAFFELSGIVNGETTPFLVIEIHLKFVIKYDSEYVSKEILELYKFRNGIMSMVSILREQVRTATFQLGLPPLILPTFKVYPPEKKVTKSLKKVNKPKKIQETKN